MKIGSRDSEKLTHFWNGIYTYGYIDKYVGFSFDFRDNTETGNTIDKTKEFTLVTGVEAKSSLNAPLILRIKWNTANLKLYLPLIGVGVHLQLEKIF